MDLTDKLPKEFFAICPILEKGSLFTLKDGQYHCYRCERTHNTQYILEFNKGQIISRNFTVQYIKRTVDRELTIEDHCDNCGEVSLFELEKVKGDRYLYQCMSCGDKQWYSFNNENRRKNIRIVKNK